MSGRGRFDQWSRSSFRAQKFRKVTLRVEHSPYVDMLLTYDVEHDIRVVLDRPVAKAGQAQLLGISRRSRFWESREVLEDGLQLIDQAEGCVVGPLSDIEVDRLIDVLARRAPQNDNSPTQSRSEEAWMRCRSLRKY